MSETKSQAMAKLERARDMLCEQMRGIRERRDRIAGYQPCLEAGKAAKKNEIENIDKELGIVRDNITKVDEDLEVVTAIWLASDQTTPTSASDQATATEVPTPAPAN